MKKVFLTINNLICILLVSVNVIQSIKYGLNGEEWCIVILAVFCIIIYIAGIIAPIKTAHFLWKIGLKLHGNSPTMNIPVESEASRIFKKRLPYFLFLANILLMVLLLVMFLV